MNRLMTRMSYPAIFHAGEAAIVHLTPEGLAAGCDPKYPLIRYHGLTVTVCARRDNRGKLIQDTYPDGEGTVEVILPFAFVPQEGAKPVLRIPVLCAALLRSGLTAATPAA